MGEKVNIRAEDGTNEEESGMDYLKGLELWMKISKGMEEEKIKLDPMKNIEDAISLYEKGVKEGIADDKDFLDSEYEEKFENNNTTTEREIAEFEEELKSDIE